QLNLEENFRSDEEIVLFNNRIFRYENLLDWVREELDAVKDDSFINPFLETYRNSGQKHIVSGKGKGYIYAEQLIHREEDEREKEEVIKEHFLLKISEIVQGHGFRLKDIAVLTRTNAQANQAVKWLLEKGYQVESELTVSIKSHPLVIEVIEFLKFLDNLSDDMAFINFITGRIFSHLSGLKQEEIFSWLDAVLIPAREKAVYRSFRDWQRTVWTDSIEFFFKRYGYLPLYEFILILYKKWGLFQTFPDSIPYFLKLSEIVQDLNSESKAGPSGLLRLWDETDVKDKFFLLKTAEDVDAVKVMTIHKSKGLQFPVVLVPFTGSQNEKENLFVSEPGNSDTLSMHYITSEDTFFSEVCHHIYYTEKTKRLVDEINDLYVAFTRPEHALFIFFEPASSQKGNKLARLLFRDNSNPVLEKGNLQKEERTGTAADDPCLLKTDLSAGCTRSDSLEWLELIKTKVQSMDEVSLNRFRAVDIGTVIHYILSLIQDYKKEELGEKIRTGIRQSGLFSGRETLQARLEQAFGNPEFLRFFQPTMNHAAVFTEKEIVDEKGNLKRTDRILVYPDKIELIDFKTGEEYEEEHRRQILGYKHLLAGFYPGKQFDCYLAYIDENKVIKI
ncbi:MAG: 3'-5' exonuclease, partial [bacterium]|nr:3'-5' exonuclease [bacterium]